MADSAPRKGSGASSTARDESAELAEVMTMILTTSPIPTCPAIDMISITLESIYRNPQMSGVKLLLVCDGCKTVKKKNAFRSGRVTAEAKEGYEKYKTNLRAEIEAQRFPFHCAQLVELEERQGFGFAVKQAMPLVDTPVVLVAQHDRAFFRSVDIYGSVQLLLRFPLRYKYIGFHTKSTRSYRQQMCSSYPWFKEHMNYERHRLLEDGDHAETSLLGEEMARKGLDLDAENGAISPDDRRQPPSTSLPSLAQKYQFSRAATALRSSPASARVPRSHTDFSWLHSFSNRTHGATSTWRRGTPSSHTSFSWWKTDLRRSKAYFDIPSGRAEREEDYVVAAAKALEPLDFVPDTGQHNTATTGRGAVSKRKGRELASGESVSATSDRDDVTATAAQSWTHGGSGRLLTVLPMLYWYDSMHVALTDYYNHFVFENDVMHNNRVLRVQRGGFIEDKLGQMQRVETEQHGVSAHRVYGTWILDDRATAPRPEDQDMANNTDSHDGQHPTAQRPEEQRYNDAVGHLHGRKFLRGGFHHNKIVSMQRGRQELEGGSLAKAPSVAASNEPSPEKSANSKTITNAEKEVHKHPPAVPEEKAVTAAPADERERPKSVALPMRTRKRRNHGEANRKPHPVHGHTQVAASSPGASTPEAKGLNSVAPQGTSPSHSSIRRKSTQVEDYQVVVKVETVEEADANCCVTM